ncbi:MAG: CsgG/HfaB family protein [Myxococcota bacterium]
MTLPRILAALLLAPLALGCGFTQLAVKRRLPAEINIDPKKTMAVAAIGGQGGEALAAELSAALMGTHRFTLVERQHLDAAMAELKLSASGKVSDETAMTFGELTGAATLVTGEVLTASYNESVRSDPSQCAREGKVVPCTNNTRSAAAKLEVTLKVVATESGHLLAAKTLHAEEARSTTATDHDPPEIHGQDEMLGTCRSAVIAQFLRVVAPYEVEERVLLRQDGDLPELERGNNYARLGDWEAAGAQYQGAIAAAKKPELKAAAQYNLSVALGMTGEFDQAMQLVEEAYAVDADGVYHEHAQHLREMKEQAARMREQESK